MKTLNQQAASGTNLTMEDIIFEGRNHSYGAFMLRKNYSKRMIEAFFLTVLFITPLFFINSLNKKPPVPDKGGVTFVTLSTEKISNEALKPPPPPEMPKEIIKDIKFNAAAIPMVVDTVIDPEDPGMAADPLAPYQQGTFPKIIYVDTIDARTEFVDLTKPYLKVEEEAIFKGGTVNDFCKWVGKQIKYPEIAAELQIKGKVLVQFVVNREGRTEDIKIIKGVDDMLDQEAIRVVASSPKWKPARQQGTDVKQQFVIPIYFQLN